MVDQLTPESIKRQPFALRYYIYIVTVAVLFGLFYIGASLLPYEPFQFYGWTGVPTTRCPNEPIDTSFISEVRGGPYTIKGFAEGNGYWVDENDVPYGNSKIPAEGVPLDPHGKSVNPSIVNRIAPPIAGEWRLGFDGRVHGRMFGIVSTDQEVIYVSKEAVTVLDDDDPRCDDMKGES